MTTSLKIELRDQELRDTLRRLIVAGQDMSPLMAELSTNLLAIAEDAFAREQDPATGAPWAPLSEATIRRRAKSRHVSPSSGQPKKLQVSRQLLDSIKASADYDRTSAWVHTNMPYAATLHFGAKQGAFGSTRRGSPIPWGDIPPRPFFGLSPQHHDQLLDLVARHITAALHR